METPEIPKKSPYVQKTKAGKYYWCACGKSSSQPFCDGSHKGTSFTPVMVEIPEEKTVAWCGCKHTKTPPYCDGTHAEL